MAARSPLGLGGAVVVVGTRPPARDRLGRRARRRPAVVGCRRVARSCAPAADLATRTPRAWHVRSVLHRRTGQPARAYDAATALSAEARSIRGNGARRDGGRGRGVGASRPRPERRRTTLPGRVGASRPRERKRTLVGSLPHEPGRPGETDGRPGCVSSVFPTTPMTSAVRFATGQPRPGPWPAVARCSHWWRLRGRPRDVDTRRAAVPLARRSVVAWPIACRIGRPSPAARIATQKRISSIETRK